jgi:uncharacterized membrane protein YfhO
VLLNGKEVPQKDNTFFKVPIEKGEHVIELLYTPFSLIVGVLVSAITALLMILSFIKHYQLKVIFEKPKNKNDIRNICILSFSISLIVYAFSLQVFEKIIKFKSTDSINWLNLHQYPKGIDFLNVLSFFAINLSVFLILVCIKYLKRKK